MKWVNSYLLYPGYLKVHFIMIKYPCNSKSQTLCMCYLFQSTCRLISHWSWWSFCVYMGHFLFSQNFQNFGSHGKTKNLTTKSKNLTTKPKTSWQNQILHSKNHLTHGKSKYSQQNQSYFAFAVKYLVLL